MTRLGSGAHIDDTAAVDSRALLDHPILAERYFFPRRDAVVDPWLVTGADGSTLHGARRGPDGDVGVLHFHGNGEVVADWADDFGGSLGAAGLPTWFAEYRGYGGSEGRPALASMLDDALAFADATGHPPERLIVYGRSVGSLYALHVAAHRRVGALVLESGIADLLQRIGLRVRPEELGATEAQLRDAVAASFDHRTKIEATQCPVLVLHAVRDHLVDFAHGEDLARWAGDRGRLVAFPRGDHNSIHAYNGPQILDEVIALAARVRAS